MSTIAQGETGPAVRADGIRTHIFLQPIAAPAALGYFAGATGFLLFGVWLGGGLGGTKDAVAMFPFLLLFAGFGQFTAGVWSVKARDAVGAALFMSWGGFWIGYGLLWLMDAVGTITLPTFAHGFEALGQWFIYMSVITWTIAIAALGRSPGQFVSQSLAAAAATIASAGLIAGSHGWQQAAGWIFVAAAAVFLYHSTALMVNALFGKVLLPHLSRRSEENVLGAQPLRPIEFPHGEPGVKVGQ